MESSVANWELEYGFNPNNTILGDRFAYVLHQAHLTHIAGFSYVTD